MHVAEIDRAIRAYFRFDPGADQPAWRCCDYTAVEGRKYVALRNGHRTLAVYRERNDGSLRRLKRWPKTIDE